MSENNNSENWSLLDEFFWHAGEGNLQELKEIFTLLKQNTLPEDFLDEIVDGKIPYSISDLTKPYKNNSTALHYAAANGHVETCKWLIDELGMGITLNDFGNSPLAWAVQNEHLDTVKYLCKRFPE